MGGQLERLHWGGDVWAEAWRMWGQSHVESYGVLRKHSTHSEEPRNPQLPMRALEGMLFLLVTSSPDLLLLLISSSCVFFCQPKCRPGPAFLSVSCPNIFISSPQGCIWQHRCYVLCPLPGHTWEHISQLPLQLDLGHVTESGLMGVWVAIKPPT